MEMSFEGEEKIKMNERKKIVASHSIMSNL